MHLQVDYGSVDINLIGWAALLQAVSLGTWLFMADWPKVNVAHLSQTIILAGWILMLTEEKKGQVELCDASLGLGSEL